MTSFSAPWGDRDAPGMKQLVADQKQYAPEQPPSIYFALAYAQGKVSRQILRKAIQVGRPVAARASSTPSRTSARSTSAASRPP